MATIYYDRDADLSVIEKKKIAVIGYGSQGHAHALNLKDSGCDVRVGLYTGSKSWSVAEAAGLRVKVSSEAAAEADIIMMLVPDSTAPDVYKQSIAPISPRARCSCLRTAFASTTGRLCRQRTST